MEDNVNTFVDNDITLEQTDVVDGESTPKTFSWVANTQSRTFNEISSAEVELEYTPNGWVIKK